MAEARDPAIKLFGRTIPLVENQAPTQAEEAHGEGAAPPAAPVTEPPGDEMDTSGEESDVKVRVPKPGDSEDLDQGEQGSASLLNDSTGVGHQTCTQDNNAKLDGKPEQVQTEVDVSGQEKTLKKPDKILPCPRCNSMDTKFCYYNNYNVNQPRHFCKNCQRYWTAGGTMRNVPVGAGRRKHKHSTSHYHHLMMSSDGLAPNRVEALDSTHQQTLPCGLSAPTRPLKVNGTVLKFGPEAPLCESMVSMLNLGDQKRNAELGSVTYGENMEEPTCASSVTASNCVESEFSKNAVGMENNGMQNYCNGVAPMPPLHCFPGSPWTYPWNPGWNSVAAMAAGQSSSELIHAPENGSPSLIPWRPPAVMATPAFCAPAISFPFVPGSYWGCIPSWPGGAWNVPWVGSNGSLSPSSSTSNSNCSGNGSPTLGKHSRDTSLGEEKMEKSLWVPKTLRIDDPDEAAKSSIWATLGIKPEKGGIFKDFQSKAESKGQKSESTRALHANPAALSRSQTFLEST